MKASFSAEMSYRTNSRGSKIRRKTCSPASFAARLWYDLHSPRRKGSRERPSYRRVAVSRYEISRQSGEGSPSRMSFCKYVMLGTELNRLAWGIASRSKSTAIIDDAFDE